jgi:hypothetical protein
MNLVKMRLISPGGSDGIEEVRISVVGSSMSVDTRSIISMTMTIRLVIYAIDKLESPGISRDSKYRRK